MFPLVELIASLARKYSPTLVMNWIISIPSEEMILLIPATRTEACCHSFKGCYTNSLPPIQNSESHFYFLYIDSSIAFGILKTAWWLPEWRFMMWNTCWKIRIGHFIWPLLNIERGAFIVGRTTESTHDAEAPKTLGVIPVSVALSVLPATVLYIMFTLCMSRGHPPIQDGTEKKSKSFYRSWNITLLT